MRANHDWFWFTSDWMKKWREFFKPTIQNQLLFDSQVKTALGRAPVGLVI